ncbi:MAG TPA: helix-turn-helix transcriptional regulator [Ktedonobacteraceae bacterium]
MQTATLVSREDEARHVTLAAQTQAVESAIQVMHTHLHEVLTLEDLASVACLSPSHFHRVFRRLIGIPPGEFLLALRFQAARRLLLTTPLSVTDICFEVGYSSTGSFTTHFTQRVGLPPRLLRRRAHAFEPLAAEPAGLCPTTFSSMPLNNAVLGRISAPATFRGTIYVGLFPSPIPQGRPVRCTRLSSPGLYLLHGMADGVYHLRAAAFPVAADLRSSLLPGEKLLVGNNASPLIIRHGQVSGDPDLVLHPPRLTDPPLVMGLPLL